MAANPKDAKAPYYLANLWYDKRQYEDAIILWETSAKLEGNYPTVWRNLSLAYFNKRNDPKSALDALERAFQLDTADARVLLELDQLYQKHGKAPIERRAFLERHLDICQLRDDLYIEYITLLNLLGDHQGAIGRAAGRQFHPWEGGEGKITGQYMHALWMLARQAMVAGAYLTAKAQLKDALHFPPNLGEGKLEGATDNNLHYELGKVYDALGQKEKAQEHYRKACRGHFDLSAAMYYNDQPADLMLYQGLAMQKLGMEAQAKACFHRLIDFAEQYLFSDVRIDYFAVSLPNLQIFEEDLNERNHIHCCYLSGLGKMGLGDIKGAKKDLEKVLDMDPAHMGAALHMRILSMDHAC